ncbi:MAG: sensor domain-containing phosphodiesterase [Alphaproteobacteria bacterium]|nr:sensor domain-containing phosphodiesterase [Alphaproteobacteria bacterium]
MEPGSQEERLRGHLASSFDTITAHVRSSLDRIVAHCAAEFDTPISLVSVAKPKHLRVLASVGIEPGEFPLETSFCIHSIRSETPLIVEDALKDPRFCDSEFFHGDPPIRSYMGYPLRHSGGSYIGALCIIGCRPKRFTSQDLAKLQTFAGVVEDILELHTIHLEGQQLTEEIQQQNQRLLTSNRLLRQAEDVAEMGAWELEIGSQKLKWSDGARAIFDGEGGDSMSLEDALARYERDDHDRMRELFAGLIETGAAFDFETDLFVPGGGTKRVRIVAERIENDGHPARVVGILKDVSRSFQADMALRHAAEHDSLTGLHNRFAFDRLLQQRLSATRDLRDTVAVLLIDLDGFKDVNDAVGHIVGDIILEEVSERISQATPDGGFAARWGGDEFAIVLPAGTSSTEAQAIGDHLIEQLRYRSEISNHLIELGATGGLAIGRSGTSVKELVRRADTALYHGKKLDPGKVHLYEAGLEQTNLARQYALNEVRTAIREDRIFPGYQPVVELRTGRVVGFEALMRLNSRSGRRITATEVFPALIDPTLSREVSNCMIELISGEFEALSRCVPALDFISINASEADLLTSGFAEQLMRRMRARNVNLSQVTLEVTETMLLVDNTQAVRRVLTELRDNGVSIALDDFGTGYSSLSHLRDFPIDKVKIDGSFIQAMASDQQATKIVRALIGMANSMGLSVIAEGVETETQSRLLQQMGCSLGQGFLFGHAEDLSRLMLGPHCNYKLQTVASAVA